MGYFLLYSWPLFLLLLALGFIFTARSKAQTRFAVLAVIVILYPLIQFFSWQGYVFVAKLHAEYRRAESAWFKQQCDAAVSSPLTKLPSTRIQEEGVLLKSNYDELLNSKRDNAIERVDGGGATFDEKAFSLLMQHKMSYVEVEMLPAGGGDYSNKGLLNSAGWSGKRYRIYYLAPENHVDCVYMPGVAAGMSSSIVVVDSLTATPPPKKPATYCMAMEVTDRPISKYFITDDRNWDIQFTMLRVRGIPMPAWQVIDWESARLVHSRTDEDIAAYRGFSFSKSDSDLFINRCHANDVAREFLSKAMNFDGNRSFLNSKSWYAGSAVQKFYEPEKVLEKPIGSSSDADICPKGKRVVAGSSIVIDQLDDHTIYGGDKVNSASDSLSQLSSFFSFPEKADVSLVEWSGGMQGGARSSEKFVVRIFSGDQLPQRLEYESEVSAKVKSISKANSAHANSFYYVFSFKPDELVLPAGNYWISVLADRFFWGRELSASGPVACGSGGAYRRSDISNWVVSDQWGPPKLPATSMPGFSFRITAKRGHQ